MLGRRLLYYPSVMALTKIQLLVLAAALIQISLYSCKLSSADEDEGQIGDIPDQTGIDDQTGVQFQDPAQIVAKALLCFNDKYVYSSCEESYRLNESGDLNVPRDKTDEYCNGPCFQETHLVLGCVENILINFLFYNKATVRDVRDTIQAGCGYGQDRGNFNVEAHIQAGESNTYKPANYHVLIGLSIMVLGNGLLL